MVMDDPRNPEDWNATHKDLDPEEYPRLSTISAASFYSFVPVLSTPTTPELVYVPEPKGGDGRLSFFGAVGQWNLLWESGSIRQELFADQRADWPSTLQWLFEEKYKDRNILLVPDAGSRLDGYTPLYQLIPAEILQRHGLPPIMRAIWPPLLHNEFPANLPIDVEDRLSQAFASLVWPIISPRTAAKALSEDSSVRLLASSLDFWLPYVNLMINERARDRGRVPYDEEGKERQEKLHKRLQKSHKRAPFTPERPLFGGEVWLGETEAREATEQMVDLADKRGRLREIIDAFRSHRVEEDFSDRWSWERADFERKLYSKRSKLKISFVQLDETIPVHGPAAEWHENLLWSELIALLDIKEREIVICLRSGKTQTDIASELGYANHSAVSKSLKRIRMKVRHLLEY
jgi:DNA-binding CsgD family transcriptional regulator